MEKTLITGANGFVGSWMTKYLIEKGHDVKVLVRKNSNLDELKGLDIEKVIGDITDADSLVNATKGVDSVFHLAGAVGYSKAARPLMDLVNVKGTQNVLEACISNNIENMLYFSSVTAIGAGFNKEEILNEDSEFNIHHLNLGYFETKHQAENLVIKACMENKINAKIVNPATIYGPGDLKKGSRKTQAKVAKGKFPFYTSGGVNIISIHDILKYSYEIYKDGNPGERHILGGENITIKRLFELIAKAASVPPPKIYLPNPMVHAIGKLGDLLEAKGKKGPINSENAWTSTMFHWFDSSKVQKKFKMIPISAEVAIKESVSWLP